MNDHIQKFSSFLKLCIIAAVMITISAVLLSISLERFAIAQKNLLPPTLKKTIWPYQCIDTMKISRDNARELLRSKEKEKIIGEQVRKVKTLGANCVAIATPYDNEFFPVLSEWVKSARANNLHVWFRGNWSGWEGWFDYPKNITTDGHIAKTVAFIKENPNLFVDNDIFTPSPEAENGNPFAPFSNEKVQSLQMFLAKEQQAVSNAFSNIGKKVTVDWNSLSGGVAKMVFPKYKNIASSRITIDHYTNTELDMEQTIDYFYSLYNTPIVLGEFGAPIPDINGQMTEKEQQEFVSRTLSVLSEKRDKIAGINYWTLSHSSTSLLNDDLTERSVSQTIRDYFLPTTVFGKIVNTAGEPIKDSIISLEGKNIKTTTSNDGSYVLNIPVTKDTATLTITQTTYKKYNVTIPLKRTSIYQQDITLTPKNVDFFYKLKLLIAKFRK